MIKPKTPKTVHMLCSDMPNIFSRTNNSTRDSSTKIQH